MAGSAQTDRGVYRHYRQGGIQTLQTGGYTDTTDRWVYRHYRQVGIQTLQTGGYTDTADRGGIQTLHTGGYTDTTDTLEYLELDTRGRGYTNTLGVFRIRHKG